MELKYEEVFKIYLWAMRLSAISPNIKRDIKWMIHFSLKHCILTILFILIMYNIIFLNLKDRDFSQTCKNGTLAVIFLETSFMHYIMFWKEHYLLSLVDNIKEDYALAKQMPVKEQEVVQYYAKRSSKVFKLWVFITSSTLGAFPVVNAVLITFYWINGEFRLIPLYDLVYPSFIENKKDSLFIFLLTYVAFIMYGAVASIMITAFVPLGPALMLHACGQLEVVKLRIEVLFKNDNIEEARMGLKEVVKRLQYIYDFVDRINVCFKIAYEVTFKAATILLPITCYEVLEALKRRELSLEFVTFIFDGAMVNSTLCFYSDLLMEKSEDLREAVYMCGWEKVYDRGIRSTLRIILLRAQRPVAIRVLFRIVCLVVLTDLSDQSFKIFNLMNAMWN